MYNLAMLSHHITGDGPPLLLVHGLGISFNIWNELRPLLRDHFTLVEVELPGIGACPLPPPTQPYLAAAVDALDSTRAALGIDRWRVLGYSTGSRVAEAYVCAYPQRVERVAFLCPALLPAVNAFAMRNAIALDRRFPVVGNWVLSGPRFRFLLRLLGFNLRRHELLPVWFDEITSQPMEALKESLRLLPAGGGAPFDIPDLPAQFIWGREDLISATPRRPSARDALIHANHSAPQTRAAEIAEVLLPFLLQQ